jgi:uncharacterized protein (TIGR02145 family)
MSKMKFLLLACFIAFLACSCSEKVTGTTEDENTVIAQGGTSSSTDETQVPEPTSSNVSSSSIAPTTSSSSQEHISAPGSLGAGNIYLDTTLYLSGDGYGGAAGGLGGFGCGGGSWNGPDTTAVGEINLITLDSVLAGRIATLIGQGKSEAEADTIAKWELFAALGIDTLLKDHPEVPPTHIDYMLDDIFGGTTKSEFFKEVTEAFAKTGTLETKHYCNFSNLAQFRQTGNPLTTNLYPARTFPNYMLYDNTAYIPKGCAGISRPMPTGLINNVARKCFSLPYCTKELLDSIIWAEHKGTDVTIGNIPFICKETGWNTPNDLEVYTYKETCDKEGKYIKGGRTDTLFVCSLDSGWYKAEAIDAETFDVPCDKHGKLYTSPNDSTKTYVCRKEHFCRQYDTYTPNAPCMDEGWDYADKNDLEMSEAEECGTEGEILRSENDPNMYYVCQKGRWSEFYNRPCDNDNERIKIQDKNITGYIEYICYDKTWRPTYEWHTDYPAEYYFNPEIDYGSFTDPRDNYEYKTTVFKNKTWMAENMKYDPGMEGATACLEDSCKNVGRFYNITVAGEICPDGWRLPNADDIKDLGYNPADFMELYSQLGGTGSHYSAPDTYGMSFILSGQIIPPSVQNDPYSGVLPWQGYTTFLWMGETDSDNRRSVAKIGTSKAETFWEKENAKDSPWADGYYYYSIRCVKK